MSKTSRRAVLAGAIALAATPATAMSGKESRDRDLLALGRQFLEALPEAELRWAQQAELRKPVERLRRRLRERGLEALTATELSWKSPAGREWHEFHDKYVSGPVHRVWVMAEQIVRMRPKTIEGLGVVALATLHMDGAFSGRGSLNTDYSKLALDCLRLSRVAAPQSLVDAVAEAAEWTRTPYEDREDEEAVA